MKKTILLPMLFALTILTNCNANNKNEKEINSTKTTEKTRTTKGKAKKGVMNVINIEYSQKVEGYKVSVVFKPLSKRYDNLVGSAMFEFDNGKKSFVLTNNHFSIPSNLIEHNIDDDFKIINFEPKDLVLTYVAPEFTEGFEVINVPFFFYDVNFDGKKELMLTEFGNGQRFVSSFKVFLLDNGELIDDYLQITNVEPFRSFDAFTKINNQTKEFILYLSSGARSSGFHTYKLDDKGILKLVEIVQDEWDENDSDKYFTNTYKVVNGEKILVTSEHKKM